MNIELKLKISFGSFNDLLSTAKDVKDTLSSNSKWPDLMMKITKLVGLASKISEVCRNPSVIQILPNPEIYFHRSMGQPKQWLMSLTLHVM